MNTSILPEPIDATGHFAGSPIDLSYRFRLERGRVASLEITA